MQLLLSMNELKLVAAVLEQREKRLSSCGSTVNRQCVADLLDKVIARDLRFGFDELEELTDILSTCDKQELAETFGVDLVETEQKLLTRILDRLTEAQAMA